MDFRIIFFITLVNCVASQRCNKADLAFLLDESSSIQPIPFSQIKQFVIDVMDGVNVGQDGSHVCVMMFSDMAQYLFRFDIINTVPLDRVKQILIDRDQRGGSTHTYRGLDLMRRVTFTPAYGARDSNDVARIVIVITDGNSQLPNRTKQTAQLLRDEVNVHVFAIGVGNETMIRQSELENIASDRQSVFRVKDAAGLDKIKGSITGAACKVKKAEPEEEYDEDWVPTEGPPEEYDENWVPTEGPPEDYA